MKTLTVPEALIALGNGEKITSSWFDDVADNKYVQLIDNKICYKDGKESNSVLEMLQEDNLRIYEEFTYPMWFKSPHEEIAKFVGLGTIERTIGEVYISRIIHTDSGYWQQVEEPKKMIKVALFAVLKTRWYQTQDYYQSKEACLKNHSYATKAKRLDYTEIEVEDYE